MEERDAADVNPTWSEWADAVLLDAPCSGLGVIRKRPDIKYTKTREDVHVMAILQRKLLTAAAAYVKHGGVLVYSTCTVTWEENEDNVRWFLENFPFHLDDAGSSESGMLARNGFFIARMLRK
jgi:16S rRNA (cytosine967-C5)-methyltransferase